MSLWRSIRGEMAGAWRSVCYDLGRRAGATDRRPDVTSTGMSTFPGSLVDVPDGPRDTTARPPRRFVAITAFCALGLTGAAGSYLVATTTFAGRMSDRAATPPAAAAPLPAEIGPEGGVAGMGGAPLARERRISSRTTPPAAGAAGAAPAPATTSATAAASATTTAAVPARPPAVERTTTPGCDCDAPPVPTPTAAPSGSSASPSVQPDISLSPSPTGSVSPSPDISASTGDSDRRHRRHDRRWR